MLTKPRTWLLMVLAFATFVVYGSLVPLQYESLPLEEGLDRWRGAMSQMPEVRSRSDWAANILLFIPLGFLATGAIRLSASKAKVPATVALIPLFAAFSASIELMQVWFPARVTSVNDVVAETIGGCIGIAGWFFAGRSFLHFGRIAGRHMPPGWAGKLVLPYLALLVFMQGMPFDLTLSPGEIYNKYKRGQIALVPSGERDPIDTVKKALVALVYFAPAGILLGRMPGRRWRSLDALARVGLVGCGLSFALEVMQIFIASRNAELLDVALGGMGVVAGWYATTRGPTLVDPRTGWRILLGTTLAGLAVLNWTPADFDFEPGFLRERLEEISFVPFADYYAGNYLLAFERMLQKLLLFVPLGLLLSRYGRTITGAGGFAVALILEAGQVASRSHTPGVSDLVLETLGALVGGLLWQQIVEWSEVQKMNTPAENRL